MAIDKSAAANEYKDRASASGDKLVRKYQAAPDKLAKSSSDTAQASYVEAMRDPKTLALRQLKLKKLSEDDLNRAMGATGASAYNNKVAASAPKWEKNTSPYLDEIDRIKATLKPRGRDVSANVTNRVLPLAKGLRDKKMSQ